MWQLTKESKRELSDCSLHPNTDVFKRETLRHSLSRLAIVALPDLVVLPIGPLERLIDLLEVVKGHKLTQFAESACQVLRAVDDAVEVTDADFLRVDLAEHLSIALAFDRH